METHTCPGCGRLRSREGLCTDCADDRAQAKNARSLVAKERDALLAQRDELEQHRYRLRDALRAVLDRHNYQGTGEPWPHLLDEVRAALAETERGAP